MAGEASLLAQYYPDDFQVSVYSMNIAAANDPTLLVYADRDLVVDSIVCGVHATVAGASFSIEYTKDIGTATPTGIVLATFALDGTGSVAGDTLVSTTDSIIRTGSTGTVNAVVTGNTVIDKDNNFIPKGNWVVIDTLSISTARAGVQIRFRSRLK